MVLPLTGIAYLILSSAVGFLTFRFFQYWRQKKDITSRQLFYFIFFLFLFSFYKAVAGLFFANNPQVLNSSMVFAVFAEGCAAAVVSYLLFHSLKFSKNVSRLAFGAIFVFTLGLSWYTNNIVRQPFVESAGSVNWGIPEQEFFYLFLRFLLLSAALVPLAFIVIKQYVKTDDQVIKSRAIGLGLAIIVGIAVGFIDFLMVNVLKMSNAFNRDIAISILGIILFIVSYLTQKSPSNSEKI